MTQALSSCGDIVKAPLMYKGKVRELYDLGEHYLIVLRIEFRRLIMCLIRQCRTKAMC